MYGNLCFTMLVLRVLCALFTKVCRFWIDPLWVVEDVFVSNYNIECVVWWCGVQVSLSWVTTSFASLLAISLPDNSVCTMTFCMVIFYFVRAILWAMVQISSLSR